MLECRIEKQFADGTTIAADFDLDPEAAEVAVLFGPSGSGKTTVLRCVAGLERPTRGSVRFDSEIWCDVDRGSWVPPQRRFVGYLFQDYALFPHLNVGGNIAYGIHHLPGAERRRRVLEVAERLGLASLLERGTEHLSGGQQQRVALGRVLARRPRLLLLDEPFSALDGATREDIRSYLVRLLSELQIPAVVVTHDWADALALGDSMIVMRDGRMLQTGTPQNVLTRPAATEVASIVGIETVQAGSRTRSGGGTLALRVGSAELIAVDPGTEEDDYWVCIRGEDVTLDTREPASSSARNHIRGEIRELVPQGALTKVTLDVGFPLVAQVTRQSALDLELARGTRIWAVFKASIVHLIPRR